MQVFFIFFGEKERFFTKETAFLPPLLFPRLQFLRRVVGFNRLRDDGTGRVTTLVVLALRRYRPRHIARTQTKRCAQGRQGCNQYRDNNLNYLLLTHLLHLLSTFDFRLITLGS